MKKKLLIPALALLAALPGIKAQNYISDPFYVAGMAFDGFGADGTTLGSGGSIQLLYGGNWSFNDAKITTPRTGSNQSELVNWQSGSTYSRTTGFVDGFAAVDDHAAGFVLPIGQSSYMPVTFTTLIPAGNPIVAAWYDARPQASTFIIEPGGGAGAQYDFLPGYYIFYSTGAGKKVDPSEPAAATAATRLLGSTDGSTFVDLGPATTVATLPAGLYQLRFANKGIILPLTITEFAAAKQGSTGLLSWKVAMEQNIGSYTVERSADGRSFTTVGIVGSLGNTANSRTYSLTDAAPLTGANYYRLKIVEKDGKVSYSEIRLLNWGSKFTIAVFPNPVKDKAVVSGVEVGMTVVLLNEHGQTLSRQKASSTTLQVQMNMLPAGPYHIEVLAKDGKLVSTTQVVKE